MGLLLKFRRRAPDDDPREGGGRRNRAGGRSGTLQSNSEAGQVVPAGQLAARRFKALCPCGRRALQFVKRHVPNAADLASRRTITAPLFLPDPLFHP